MSTSFHSVKNNAEGYLSAAIESDSTSLSLDTGEGSSFPSENFWISINSEILECSARTGDDFTVSRGEQDTVATSHDAGDKVELLHTAGAMEEIHDAINTLEDNPVGENIIDNTMLKNTDDFEMNSLDINSGKIELNSTGNMTVDGNFEVKGNFLPWEITLDASDGNPTSSSGCQVSTISEIRIREVEITTLDFDKDSDERAFFNFIFPLYYDGGPIIVDIFWTFLSGSGNVKWICAAGSFDDDDALDQAIVYTSFPSVAAGTAEDVHITSCSSFTPANAAAGNFGCLIIIRDVDPHDDFTEDVKLMGVRIRPA
jgi:hypothetical protein